MLLGVSAMIILHCTTLDLQLCIILFSSQTLLELGVCNFVPIRVVSSVFSDCPQNSTPSNGGKICHFISDFAPSSVLSICFGGVEYYVSWTVSSYLKPSR